MQKLKQLRYITNEMLYLVKKNRFYFIAPLLLLLAILVLVVFYVGPTVVITFMYAGL